MFIYTLYTLTGETLGQTAAWSNSGRPHKSAFCPGLLDAHKSPDENIILCVYAQTKPKERTIMTKETLLHATDLYTTIQKIEQLLTIFEKNSIEEVKVRGFDWKPSTEQETRIRTAILADQREELERLKAELAAL